MGCLWKYSEHLENTEILDICSKLNQVFHKHAGILRNKNLIH